MNLGRIEVAFCTLALAATNAADGSVIDVDWSVALVPPHTEPGPDTTWVPVEYADGVATLLLAGPEADPTGALRVAADSDLYVLPTGAPPEVLPVLVERITTR